MALGDMNKRAFKAGLRALNGDPQGFDELARLAAFVILSGASAAFWYIILFPQQPEA